MKLLVLAQTPPPVHGQSLAVQSLISALSSDSRFEVHHVNLGLSRDTKDIGRWRPGKLISVLRACGEALHVRWKNGPMALYYVPAPAKRGALYRDWIVMLICRPFFPKLVLHWHAVGLGQWLGTHVTGPERWLTRTLLGHADLSISLANALVKDAAFLAPRRIAITPYGVPDPAPTTRKAGRTEGPFRVVFLALGCAEKGLFDTIEAIRLLNIRGDRQAHLTVAGTFASTEDESQFARLAATLSGAITHVGFVDETAKLRVFQEADVFCFPTYYPHEAQPLVLIEALAHDLPIITTRWRAIPEMLPTDHVWYVEPRRPDQIADALVLAREAGPAHGTLRAHYEHHFTAGRHLDEMKTSFLSLNG